MYLITINRYMSKTSNKSKTKKKAEQKNKNNKTKPKNLERKEYSESLEELKKSIKDNQQGQ